MNNITNTIIEVVSQMDIGSTDIIGWPSAIMWIGIAFAISWVAGKIYT